MGILFSAAVALHLNDKRSFLRIERTKARAVRYFSRSIIISTLFRDRKLFVRFVAYCSPEYYAKRTSGL